MKANRRGTVTEGVKGSVRAAAKEYFLLLLLKAVDVIAVRLVVGFVGIPAARFCVVKLLLVSCS